MSDGRTCKYYLYKLTADRTAMELWRMLDWDDILSFNIAQSNDPQSVENIEYIIKYHDWIEEYLVRETDTILQKTIQGLVVQKVGADGVQESNAIVTLAEYEHTEQSEQGCPFVRLQCQELNYVLSGYIVSPTLTFEEVNTDIDNLSFKFRASGQARMVVSDILQKAIDLYSAPTAYAAGQTVAYPNLHIRSSVEVSDFGKDVELFSDMVNLAEFVGTMRDKLVMRRRLEIREELTGTAVIRPIEGVRYNMVVVFDDPETVDIRDTRFGQIVSNAYRGKDSRWAVVIDEELLLLDAHITPRSAFMTTSEFALGVTRYDTLDEFNDSILSFYNDKEYSRKIELSDPSLAQGLRVGDKLILADTEYPVTIETIVEQDSQAQGYKFALEVI